MEGVGFDEVMQLPQTARDRMQGMTLGVLGALSATANWHRIMCEWLYEGPPSSPLGEADAEFFDTLRAPARRAA